MTRKTESGVSLLNVLVVVAATAGVVQSMLTGQETAISQVALSRDASQARALADAGVTSLSVALRRDLLENPEEDHQNEPWAKAAQSSIEFEFGRYSVAVEDMRGRFDLNALGPAQLVELRVFASLLRELDLPQALAGQVARIITSSGPIASPRDLIRFGLSPADLVRLDPHITALPVRHTINVNAADAPLLAALVGNPVAAQTLLARRSVKGFLERSDFTALGLVLPPLTGFTSDAFLVHATSEVGRASAATSKIILRDAETGSITTRPFT